MFRRLKASLANPSSIPLYRKDNIFLVLLYILALCFIATLPTLVDTIRSKEVSEETKFTIREVLVENRNEFLNGKIENNTLTVDAKQTNLIFEGAVAILFPADDTDPVLFAQNGTYYVVKLNDHDISVFFLGNKIKTYSYTELGLDGLDFNFIKEVDYKARVLEFEVVEKAYDKIVNDIKPFWGTINVVSEFFKIFIIAIIFDLICAFLARGIKGLSFKEGFVIIMYAFAMESVGQIIDALYGFAIFSFIGSFIGIIYFIIALRNTNDVRKEVIK